MVYLTYNDQPSGIYFSQVTDVCNYITSELKVEVRLVALISIRGFSENKKKIRARLPSAIVIPMIPKHKNWKLNTVLVRMALRFIGEKKKIMGRGVFATSIALRLKSLSIVENVVFDGRGAYAAEFSEYLNKIVDIKDDVFQLEKNAVLTSDMRLAVSRKLVDYWRESFGYPASNHVIIPCTLSSKVKPTKSFSSTSLRQRFGYNETDIILVYAGSNAEWQSKEILDAFMLEQLTVNTRVKVLLLSRFDLEAFKSYKAFPDRINQKWVSPGEVEGLLSLSDYGLLIRNNSITNKVASPTKFAEYLQAGLKVIISDEVGDFPEFVRTYDAGYIYKNGEPLVLESIELSEKTRMSMLAAGHFNKTTFREEYKQLVS